MPVTVPLEAGLPLLADNSIDAPLVTDAELFSSVAVELEDEMIVELSDETGLIVLVTIV